MPLAGNRWSGHCLWEGWGWLKGEVSNNNFLYPLPPFFSDCGEILSDIIYCLINPHADWFETGVS